MVDGIILRQQDAQGQPLSHPRVELRAKRLHVGPLDGPCLLSKKTHQHVVQLRGFDGLGQKGRQLDPFRVGFSLSRSQHDQGQCLRIALPPYLGRQHQAVHLWHLHIQDGHVKGIAPPNPVQCLDGRTGVPWEHPPRLRLQRQNLSVSGVVIHNQHPLATQIRLGGLQVGARGTGCRFSLDGEVEG